MFVCTEFSGRPKADNEEMCGALFVPRETLCEEFADSLFPPFKDSLLEFQKTAQTIQFSEVEKFQKSDIIKSLETCGDHIDSHIPEDKVIYRETEQGKTIAINSETGETSGCGPEIDNGSNPKNSEESSSLHDKKENGSYDSVKKEFLERLATGKISKKLNVRSQSKHSKGSEEYNKAIAEGGNPSYLSISETEMQKIIDEYSFSGKHFKRRDDSIRVKLDYKKPIGTYVSREGREKETSRGTIHYSKKGAHIVPANPDKED